MDLGVLNYVLENFIVYHSIYIGLHISVRLSFKRLSLKLWHGEFYFKHVVFGII